MNLFVQCHKIRIFKGKISSHEDKKYNTTRPKVCLGTIVALIVDHLSNEGGKQSFFRKHNNSAQDCENEKEGDKPSESWLHAYLWSNIIWSSTSCVKQSIFLITQATWWTISFFSNILYAKLNLKSIRLRKSFSESHIIIKWRKNGTRTCWGRALNPKSETLRRPLASSSKFSGYRSRKQ